MMSKTERNSRPMWIRAAALIASATLSGPAMAASSLCPANFEKADRQSATTDMVLRSESTPVMALDQPYRWDWLLHGRVGSGNDANGGNRILPWVAIFAAKENAVGSARVELSNLEIYVLSKRTAMWTRLISGSQVWGQLFTDPAGSQAVAPLEMVRENASVSISVDGRYMSHFWSQQSVAINANDIAGVYVTAQARMNPQDYAAGARFVMDVAADYYRSDTYAQGSKSTYIDDAGIGRLKLLTPQWRKYYMTTVKPVYLDLCVGSGS